MNILDWIISAIFLSAILGIGIKLSRKSGESAENFFVAGRKMPWWLAGMSSAATSFASDSPLHMSAMTRRAGFLGCWFYWRVNVKTEITAILTSLIVAVTFSLMKKAGLTTPADALIEATGIRTGNFPFKDLYFAVEASMIAAITVISACVCMAATKSSSPEVLDNFYRRIQPTGPGWKPVAARCPDVVSPDALHRDLEGVIWGLLFSFCFIFAFGYTFVGSYSKALLIAATLPVWGYLLHRRCLRWLKNSA